ncbi:MAG: hypothetical protein IPM77_17330 [Crocinitomicaceae bacterium]|nr:hypothetical protein [Crocinitomicaceae bacterium]
MDRQYYQNMIADLLVSNGYFESMNNSLISSQHTSSKAAYINPEETVKILNPLSKELDVMRQTLLPGLMQSVTYNQNRQQNEIKLFEFGKVYSKKEIFNESEKLVIVISGDRNKENWKSKNEKADFYSIKATVELVVNKLGLEKANFTEEPSHKEMGYGQSVQYKKTELIYFGCVSPLILKEFGIRSDVFYAEFDWDKILEIISGHKIEYKPVPKTQFVRRDFSLLIDTSVRFQQIENIAFSTDKKLLRDVNLFDVYEGKNLPAGKKSYAVSFTFQDDEKTLQDSQIDQLMDSIRKKLESELKAELR